MELLPILEQEDGELQLAAGFGIQVVDRDNGAWADQVLGTGNLDNGTHPCTMRS
jgi:hypothetical protein